MSGDPRLGIVVLVSGSGTNLQAILDQAAEGRLPVEVRAVVSNRPGVQALERARCAGAPAHVLDHREYDSREAFDRDLMRLIDRHDPGLVVLAGYMRILTPGFVRHYEGRMLNIHPSLLPRYRGLHTHRRALDAGDRQHGASVHFVTEELDGGPVVLQAKLAVRPDDDEHSLARRVQKLEHVIYPRVIAWFAEGRLEYREGRAWLDGRPLDQPEVLE